MDNQVNQSDKYYTKEETLYLCLLSELKSQQDYLEREKKRTQEAIAKNESPSFPDDFRNYFEDQVFGYYRENENLEPIEGVLDLEEHNPDISNKLLLAFLSQQIANYNWVIKYNQELYDKKDFRRLYTLFSHSTISSDIPLLSKDQTNEVADFYYDLKESKKGNLIRCDIEEIMTEIEYDFDEDQRDSFTAIWESKVGDEIAEKKTDPEFDREIEKIWSEKSRSEMNNNNSLE